MLNIGKLFFFCLLTISTSLGVMANGTSSEGKYNDCKLLSRVLLDINNENADLIREEEGIIKFIKESINISEEDIRIAVQLEPIFESGIVYRAITDTLYKYGKTNRQLMINTVKGFPALDHEAMMNMVDSIILSIADNFRSEFNMKDIHEISNIAKQIHMDQTDLINFYQSWREQARKNHDALRSILISQLKNPGRDLINAIHNGFNWFGRYRYRRDIKSAVPVINKKEGTILKLLRNNTSIAESTFTTFLDRSSIESFRYFLQTQYLSLTNKQLQKVIKSGRFNLLSQELKDLITSRAFLFEEIDRLEKHKINLQSRLDLYEEVIKGKTLPQSTVKYDDIKKQLERTKDLKTSGDDFKVFQGILKRYWRRLPQKDLFKTFEYMINATEYYKYASDDYQVFKLVVKYGGFKELESEFVAELNKRMIKLTKKYHVSYVEKVFDLVDSWKPIPPEHSAMSLEQLRMEVERIKGSIAETENNIEQLTQN